ncbi:MAG: Mrp/NBP35 family ATP-binding protein [Bacillota bacterium]
MADDKNNGGACGVAGGGGGCPGSAACSMPEARTCGQSAPRSHVLESNPQSAVKNVIAVMSGKGGVGKSAVTALLAVTLARQGYKVGILDADLTGPSIPKIFGLHERPELEGEAIKPVKTRVYGIGVISINLLLEREDEPVIWRGPIIAGAIQQFWTEVGWGELDYLLVDLPPGTGDAPLSVMQFLPVSGVVMVAAPQELAVLVVRKAVRMVRKLHIPIVGFVENMSYVVCPRCDEKLELFGPSQAESVADSTGLRLLARIPLDSRLSTLSDRGEVEKYETEVLAHVPAYLDEIMNRRPENPGMPS